MSLRNQLLIDFDPARGCDQLARLAGTHTRFALTKDHYDHFLEVLMQTIEPGFPIWLWYFHLSDPSSRLDLRGFHAMNPA